ncbi:MAG: DNRLRE domain-containing protein [Verrucomicrobiota bacterium]
MKRVAILIVGLAVVAATANATIVIDAPTVQDNTTWSAAPDAVSNTDHIFVRDQTGSDVHAYIEFGLSGLSGYSSSDIVSAEMKLLVDYNNNGGQTAKIDRIDADWSTSTLTWNNAPGVTDIGVTTTAFGGANGWETIDITDLVKSWLDGTANEGVRISYLPSAYTHQANIRSSEYAGTDSDPYLQVEVIPEPATLGLLVVGASGAMLIRRMRL